MIKILHLLKVVDMYQKATGFTDSTISTYVFNAGEQVKPLRSGRDITVGRFNYALKWFSAHWPEGAAWPEDIARPSAGDEAAGLAAAGSDEIFQVMKRRRAKRKPRRGNE